MKLAARSKSKIDDILVRRLHPFRMAWLAPLAVIYITAFLFPDVQVVLSKVSLFFILWLSVLTLNGLLNAINEIYESRPNYNGVSIQGYLDIAKLLIRGGGHHPEHHPTDRRIADCAADRVGGDCGGHHADLPEHHPLAGGQHPDCRQ